MKTRFLGGTLPALLLALALAGCGGPGGNAGGAGTGGTTNTGTGSGSPSDPLVKVGDTQITRGQLDQHLEGRYGTSALPDLIDSQLVADALTAKKQTVSDTEVSDEITRLEDNNPRIKAVVDSGGPRLDFIKSQLRNQLSVQKLLTADTPAKDADVQAFYNKFASYYSTPAQNKIGVLAASTKTRADQLSRSLQTKPDSFAALVAEQKKTNDQIAQGLSSAGDGPTARFEAPEEFGSARLPPQIASQLAPALAPTIKALTTAKKGQILPVQSLTPRGPFFIVKIIDRKDAVKPDFAKIKAQVTTDYQLAQAAQTEIKKSQPKAPPIDQIVKNIVGGAAQPNPQTGQPGSKVSLRDALLSLLQTPTQTLLQELRGKGSVQISDPTYKEVARAYAPAPSAATGNSAAGAPNGAPGASAPATANSAVTTTNSAAPATNSSAPAANSSAPATNSAAPKKP